MIMNKTVEELQEEIDELKQTVSGHNDELQGREDAGYDKAMLEIDSKIDHAFNAGWESGYEKEYQLKSLLNYKMEQRL